MRVAIWLLVVVLTVLAVEGKKPKGKGKPSKPKPEGTGEEPVTITTEKPSKGKGKGKPSKGKGKPTKPEKPGKGKGKPSKPEKPEEPEEPERPEPEPRGFCISPEEMHMICAAGSALGGARMYSAMEQCGIEMGGEEQTRGMFLDMRAKKPKGKPSKGKGKPSKGKGKPSKCPSVQSIMDMAEEKYAGEACVFTEMGWLDNDMVANEDAIMADIMTLPYEISDALNSDEYVGCIADIEKSAMGFGKCMKSYSDEEQQQLTELFNGVAHVQCFEKAFEQGCEMYMSNTIYAMAGNPGTGSGSGFGSDYFTFTK